MTPESLYKKAIEAKEEGSNFMTLALPRPFKRPKGFPRGELLCEQPSNNVYSFKADKIIKWLAVNDLINND